MSALQQSLGRIPYWAYLLVLMVVVVNSIYLFYRHQIANDGAGSQIENGQCIIIRVQADSPAAKAGLRIGDILESIDSTPIKSSPHLGYLWFFCKSGEKVIYKISRNNHEFNVPVILRSILSEMPGFFQAMFTLILILSIASFYLLYKKSDDPSAIVFFIYIQLFAIAANARILLFHDPVASFATVVWQLGGCLLGPALIHFHLLFPRPSSIYKRFIKLPMVFYGIGLFVFIFYSLSYLLCIYNPDSELYSSALLFTDKIVVWWMTITFAIALAVVIYQFKTIKITLARNQLRIVIIGSFFGFITPMTITFFYQFVNQLQAVYPFTVDFSHGIGSFIMISCILIAIFRYRIWDVEVFIRKALIYLAATAFITLSYLLLIWLVDQVTMRETNLTHFLILAISVIFFLVQRDRIQRLVDRFFHRESYDSATVVSEFEEKLEGIYRFEELKEKIVQGLDEIFHFKSFVFNLKKNNLIYEPAFVYGIDEQKISTDYEITIEFEEKLRKSKVFSPEELNKKPHVLEISTGELIVPMVSDNQPNGFFVCGPKMSERIYSHQDIRVLSLLARRVIALLHTASLYQKDLDRQLMLERERARISQDMHDDIGAGLTKIAMISESPAKIIPTADCRLPTADPDPEAEPRIKELRDRMNRVASSARDMISRLNVIVWALNPKYDTLDSLIAYSRRYFGEYLDNSGIRFKMELPDVIPELDITPDFRRNVFYAIQEAIHNAVKHGDCSEIIFGMKISQQTIEIIITDNGKGFDQNKKESYGNGLRNMKKRAEDLGGSFEIHSSQGDGTKVLFTISLQEDGHARRA